MASQPPIPAASEAPPTSALRPPPPVLQLLSSIFYLLPLALLWILLIYNLGAQWSIYEQYNYGWSVPFLCAYLVWRKVGQRVPPASLSSSTNLVAADVSRRSSSTQEGSAQVAADVSQRNSSVAEISAPPNAGGYVASSPTALRPPVSALRSTLSAPRSTLFVLLALCLLAYAPTRWLHEANPVWRLTSWLWAIEVIAITLILTRYELGAKRLAQVAFATCFFLVAVPWPWPVEQSLVQAFTHLNSSATVELLGLLGVPAAQHGNVIEINAGNIGIDEACSGIRSFQATLMISLFLGEIYSLTALRRALCVLGGFAFSMIFNLGRTLLLVFVASSKGISAIDSWHDPAGVTILVLCFLSLWLLALVLRRGPTGSLSACEARKDSPSPPLEERAGERRPSADMASVVSGPVVPSLVVSVSLLAWLVVVEAGTELWYRSHERTEVAGQDWSIQIPSGDSAYKIAQVPKGVVSEFKYDLASDITWQDASGDRWQLFYFRWLPARSLDRRVKVQRAKMHGPDTCLPHAGMTLKSDLGEITIAVGQLKLAFHQYAFEVDRGLFYVFFGIYEDLTGSDVLANRRIGTANRVRAALAGSRNYGQRFLEIAVWGIEDPKEAEAALTRELEKLVK